MAVVNITLDGDEVELRCTPLALKTICAKYGDLVAVNRRVAAFDYNAFVDVIAAGIGDKRLKALEVNRDKLETVVFNAGLSELLADVTKFILMLANGGKEPKSGETDDEGAPSEGNE